MVEQTPQKTHQLSKGESPRISLFPEDEAEQPKANISLTQPRMPGKEKDDNIY